MSHHRRVLMLLENNPYPHDPRVSREARSLTRAGYEVSVICPSRTGQPWCETLGGVFVCRFPAPPPPKDLLGYLWEYGYSTVAIFVLSLYVFLRKGFDVIHAANPPDTLVLIAMFYKLLGKRFIFDHHDLSPEMYYARFRGAGNPLVHRALVLFEKASCWLADHVITTNESYRRVAMERGRVPQERITVVRNGPDLNVLRPVEPDPALRQKGRTMIAYVGVMGFQDGVDYLLRALHHLIHNLGGTDFFCILAGGGDAFLYLRSLAEELQLGRHVLFTGFVNPAEVARYLSAADICVAPEPSDPYNDCSTAIKIMEYMALAKPVVAFDLPEHRFTAQAAALYVKPNDEFAFARALAALADNPARRKAMGLFGRRRVETTLAWQYSIPSLLKAYNAVFCQPTYEREAVRQAVVD